MRIPNRLQELIPPDAVKQLMDLVGQPSLVNGLREAAQKLGWKDAWQTNKLRDAMQQAKRWVESVGIRLDRSGGNAKSQINATGLIFAEAWSAKPACNQALQAYIAVMSGYSSTSLSSASIQPLADLAGAEKATLIHSIPLALQLIAKLSEAQNGFVVPRADCLRFGSTDFRSLLAAHGQVVEVGASNSCNRSDLDQGLTLANQVTITLFPSSLDAGNEVSSHHDSAVEAAHDRQSIAVELVLNATPHDLSEFGLKLPTIAQRIQAGADLLIVPGDGLLGGPQSALVIGKANLIDAIEKLAKQMGCEPSVGEYAAMVATADSVSDFAKWKSSPIGAMIANNAANLEDRARRLAIQIQACEAVSSVSTETVSQPIGDGVWGKWSLDSTALRIVPRHGSVEELARDLAEQPVPIIGLVKPDALLLVLRTVDPSEDRDIAHFFLRSPSSEPSGTSNASTSDELS